MIVINDNIIIDIKKKITLSMTLHVCDDLPLLGVYKDAKSQLKIKKKTITVRVTI